MKWADWDYIDENEDHFPGVHESSRACGVDEFVGHVVDLGLTVELG